MKSIISVKDLDPSDFVIKWRITEMCNANCSYCIRKARHEFVEKEMIPELTEKLCYVAEQISRFINETDFHKVKLDLIGGEVSIFNLVEILSYLNTDKISRINITTNFLKPADYYKRLCDFCKSKNMEITAVASYHYEFQTFEKYFEKINKLRDKFTILCCEMVSHAEDQKLVKRFIERCKSIGIDYMVEGDIRSSHLADRKNGLIVDGSRPIKKDRYHVVFSDGTEKNYVSRNSFLMDSSYEENYMQKSIKSKGFICTNSSNFVYIDFDIAVGRTADSDSCTNRMPISEFKVVEPRPCPSNACTLCGHMSLWK